MSASKLLKVTIKHGKSKHKGVELDMETMSFEGLQGIIFSLTQVSPERQKIIIKGKQIENDNDLKYIKNKSTLVVMGSVETETYVKSSLNNNNNNNNSKVQFMEDMTDKEKQQVNAALPPGLYNLGNTCYLNSTLQCMKGIKELRDELIDFTGNSNGNNNNNANFTKELSSLFLSMNSTSDSVNPTSFVQDFRTRFPEFATRNEQGAWEQQDADECLTKILNSIKMEGFNNIDNLFEGEFESSMKCIESEDESIVNMKEKFYKLRCFIDSETRHISFGISKSMKEELTKHSNILNRNSQWIKTQKISKLPKYLTISMVRFFWKQSKQKNAKILRSVQFDMKLDITNFCNDKLKSNISKFRKLKMEAEDEIRELNQKKGISTNDKTNDKTNNSTSNDTKGNNDKSNDDTNKQDKIKEEKEEKKVDAMEIDSTNNNKEEEKEEEAGYESGFYELVGLITHKGLSANSGHYIGYSKDSKRGWLKFDDDVVTSVTEDDIKKLYGGGQWQMGYVCFYKKIDAVIPTK